MPLTCNIDARGKALRLIVGLVFFGDGILLALLWGWRAGSHVGWITSIVMMAVGAFMMFEGWKGWCVVRAMGFKTRV